MDHAAVWLTAGGMAVTVLAWLFGLQGRQQQHEQRLTDYMTRNDREHATHTKRHEEMREDITYIRERIDRALNGRGAV